MGDTEQQIVPETPDTNTPEAKISLEKQDIIESAVIFADYLTSRFPQVDNIPVPTIDADKEGVKDRAQELPEDTQIMPMLNYYLAGSLAIMLLAQAEQFTEVTGSDEPGVKEGETRPISEGTRLILASFARPVGDLDYVATEYYRARMRRVQEFYKKIEIKEYRQMRANYLWKGGGPTFEEFPKEALICLVRGEEQTRIMIDPVEAYGPNLVAKVVVDEKEYYIARPDAIFTYKVLHLLQGYEHKPEKFNADFSKLFSAIKEMYSEDDLLKITLQILSDYEAAMKATHMRLNTVYNSDEPYEHRVPAFIKRTLDNQSITPEIREFIQRVQNTFLAEEENQ